MRRIHPASPRFLFITLFAAAKSLLLSATTILLIACGGSSSDATVPQQTPDSAPQPTITAQATVVSVPVGPATAGGGATGLTVVRYELVSSTRVSRTVFDYTYRVMVQVEGQNYPNGALLTVNSTSPATTFPDPNVSLGPLVAFSIAEPTDTFTLRQDRTVPFDGDGMNWTVSGDTSSPPEAPLSLLAFDFVRDGGRDGHGTVSAITSAPAAGPHLAALTLSAPVGSVSVALNSSSSPNQLGVFPFLPRNGEAPAASWIGSIDVPSNEFTVEVRAVTHSGEARSLPVSMATSGSSTALELKPPRISLWRTDTAGKTLVLSIRNPTLANTNLAIEPLTEPGLLVTVEPISITLDDDGEGSATITVTSEFQNDSIEIYNPQLAVSNASGDTLNEIAFLVMVYPHE